MVLCWLALGCRAALVALVALALRAPALLSCCRSMARVCPNRAAEGLSAHAPPPLLPRLEVEEEEDEEEED